MNAEYTLKKTSKQKVGHNQTRVAHSKEHARLLSVARVTWVGLALLSLVVFIQSWLGRLQHSRKSHRNDS